MSARGLQQAERFSKITQASIGLVDSDKDHLRPEHKIYQTLLEK
jgi:hypothetical protein